MSEHLPGRWVLGSDSLVVCAGRRFDKPASRENAAEHLRFFSGKAMEGLIAEGNEVVGMSGDPVAKDAALIAGAQRIEHYEIAGYGTARTLADELGLDEARDLLEQTLDEEANADKLLTKIATGGMFRAGVNQAAT